jgi:hypothetical protein
MQVEQTSPTTFELHSDNGCHVFAGFAANTMQQPGVYWWRDTITKADAEAAFLADERVRAAITKAS